MSKTSTAVNTTGLRAQQVQANGLIYYKAVVDHAVEHGLPAPASIDLTDDHVKVWLTEGKEQWGESITVDDFTTTPSPIRDRVIVYVDGRLPFMNLAIRLAFSHEQTGSAPTLRVVGA